MPQTKDGGRVADRLARCLHAAGVRHAFGMPGGEVITFIDALEAAGIRFVLARNETAAAMMAAGTAAQGQQPGLLVTTLGPGLANAVNGIADAAQEHTPLIVVSGVVERPIRARYTHQIVDHAAMLRPLVKATFEIEPEAAQATVERAIRLALTPPFGPVHLDLSPVIAAMPAPGPVAPSRSQPVRRPRPDPRDPAIAQVRERLAAARRPLVIAGLEAARSNAAAALATLADTLGVPIITTYKGKGVVDERHPRSLGAAGLSPLADPVLLDVVRRADLVLLAGYDPIEMRPGWLAPFTDPAAVIEIGEAPGDHGMHESGSCIIGSVGPVLDAVVEGLASGASLTWPEGEPETARAELLRRFAAPEAWGPHAVFDILAQELPESATVTVDSGAHRILLSQKWQAHRPLSMLQSAGWCTMGSAIPLAIGAALSRPGPCVAVLGDGGMEMTMGELGTLRDTGLPVVVLVLQDESLALIELKQRQSQLAPLGVRMGATAFDTVAQAFGGAGVTVTDATGLRTALRDALAATRFSVVACRVDASSYLGRI